jgi:hypothetical protein
LSCLIGIRGYTDDHDCDGMDDCPETVGVGVLGVVFVQEVGLDDPRYVIACLFVCLFVYLSIVWSCGIDFLTSLTWRE